MENKKRIDYTALWKALYAQRKLFLKTLPITFVVACLIILPQPRYYTSTVMLAPEGGNEINGGSLSSLASSFGFNLGGASNDAIYPMLYPDLFESPEFIVDILRIKVPTENLDGHPIRVDYYTYLKNHQRKNWLTYPFVYAYRYIKQMLSSDDELSACEDAESLNPFRLSKKDYEFLELIPKLISCSVDKKTDVATISVTDQSAEVCALMADSVRERLQLFIINYRTAKARKDLAYYQNLADSAQREYERSVKKYANYCDTHQNATLQSYISERDKLENAMALKYEAYSSMLTQVTMAKAKVQERTPAFTTLKTPTVPAKPAGPKRMIFVAAMLLLAAIGTTIYILRKLLNGYL